MPTVTSAYLYSYTPCKRTHYFRCQPVTVRSYVLHLCDIFYKYTHNVHVEDMNSFNYRQKDYYVFTWCYLFCAEIRGGLFPGIRGLREPGDTGSQQQLYAT